MEFQQSTVSLTKVTSSAVHLTYSGIEPVVREISAEMYPGECWGIYANEAAASRTLCEIIGNQQYYFSGKVRVGPSGMVLKKRLILSHLFFINDSEMLYPNMNLLEAMLFLTMETDKREVITRQKEMLDLLEQVGFSHLALSTISIFTPQERMLAELFAAVLSKSSIIVCDMVRYPLEQADIPILVNILKMASERNKTVILATEQPKVVGMACSHTLLIYNGNMVYSGTVENAIESYDDVVCALTDDATEELTESIKKVFPGFSPEVIDKTIYLHNPNKLPFSSEYLYTTLSDNNLAPSNIQLMRGRLENAYLTMVRGYKNDI